MITQVKRILGVLGVALIPFLLINCGTATNITGTWSNPEATLSGYDAILVTALTPNVVARRAVESSVVKELQAKGVNAKSSIEVFPPNFMNNKPTKEEVLAKVREEKMKGVLTIALLDTQEDTRYVPGTTAYAPYPRYGYYGSFGGYYGAYYGRVYDPGYYTTSRTYFLENNLYDTDSEDLVWSAQSKSYDPSNVDAASKSLAKALVYEMDKEGILK